MKKILFSFSAILLVLFSCSDNQEVIEPANHNTARISRVDLQNLYNHMIDSQDYKNFDAAEDIFIDKMNYVGDGSDLESLGTLGWITANIAQTDFASTAAAELEYNNLLALQDIVLTDNDDFFDAFLDEDNHADLIDIMTPRTTSEDECGCGTAYDACKRGVELKYAKAMKIAKEAERIVSRKAYNDAVKDARTIKKQGSLACKQAYDLCLEGC